MPDDSEGSGPRRGLVVAGVMCSVFLAAMESTVVATAMPTVIASLGGIRIYSWVFSGFLLTSTVTMPLWGRLADQLGRRRTYLGGLMIFLLGSALSGLAQSMPQLILFRALQGIGAGSLIPIGMTIIGDLYGIERRARMQGYFSSVWGVASVIGPLLGGVLADTVSWRWVFYINLPFGFLAAAAIAIGLQGQRRPRGPVSLDYLGMALFSGSVSALLMALVDAGRGGSWLTGSVIGLVGLSALLLGGFLLVEWRAPEPLIPLALVTNPMVRAACATGLFSGMAMFGALAFVPLFLQAVIGSTATEAGFVLTPFILGWVGCSILGARLVLRLGYRPVVIVGMCALVGAFVLLTGWNQSLSRLAAARDMLLAGVGMGLVFVPMLIAVQSAVPRAVLGSATSVTGFFRTIGGAVGVAVMGSVMTQRLRVESANLLAAAPASVQEALGALLAQPDLVVNSITRAAIEPQMLGLVRLALAQALGGVFLVGLIASLAALATAFLVPAGQARALATAREPATSSRP